MAVLSLLYYKMVKMRDIDREVSKIRVLRYATFERLWNVTNSFRYFYKRGTNKI